MKSTPTSPAAEVLEAVHLINIINACSPEMPGLEEEQVTALVWLSFARLSCCEG